MGKIVWQLSLIRLHDVLVVPKVQSSLCNLHIKWHTTNNIANLDRASTEDYVHTGCIEGNWGREEIR